MGNKHTKDSFFKKRISINEGELVRLNRLDRELFLFNGVYDVRIRAVLKPGEEFGTTNYVLMVEEPRKYECTVFTDNAGQKDIGLYRAGTSAVINSLFGFRDHFTVGGVLADGTKSAYLSYNFPINTRGTRLGLSLDYSETSIISGPTESLNIEGDFYNVGAFLSHPFIIEQGFKLNGFTGANYKRSTTDFDSLTLFETNVRTLSLGTDFQVSIDRSALYSRHYFTKGLA